MILIADSGSTKTEWVVIENGKRIKSVTTPGINPYYQTEQEISNELSASLLPEIKEFDINRVYFYGAGCLPEKHGVMKSAIAESLAIRNSEINTDMQAAAHAMCGTEPGIVCIMGTGSNSCFYDGKAIKANVSPLGFILGDEGSGAVLGKLFVGDILKNQMPEKLKEEFLTEFNLSMADIIERVYRKPFPNRFLASFAPFIMRHIHEPQVRSLVENSFRAFFKRNVMQYDYKSYNVHIIGSVAYHFREVLQKVAAENNIRLGKIQQAPMEGLIAYHSQN